MSGVWVESEAADQDKITLAHALLARDTATLDGIRNPRGRPDDDS
jgi:hypothetical protein